jgi:hypothetical protein
MGWGGGLVLGIIGALVVVFIIGPTSCCALTSFFSRSTASPTGRDDHVLLNPSNAPMKENARNGNPAHEAPKEEPAGERADSGRQSEAASKEQPEAFAVRDHYGWVEDGYSDVSGGGIIRKRGKIRVPDGLAQGQVEACIRDACETLQRRHSAHATEALAYRLTSDIEGSYTVGVGRLAPGGKWERAGESGRLECVVEILPTYFSPPKPEWQPGARVILCDKGKPEVRLFKTADGCKEDHIIKRLPNGTKVRVTAVKVYEVAEHVSIQYCVETDDKVMGWVWESELARQ